VTLDIFVTREARADIAEAIAGFRDISPALATRFGAELERIYANVVEYPEMYPVVYKTFRRGLLRKFPYSIFYVVEASLILIVGVVHQARDESTWKRRA
jgi:toxin ParE1/3/4